MTKHKEIFETPVKAEVALLYDFDNIWSWRIQRENGGFDFHKEAVRLYEPFYRQNIAVDVIRYDLDLSDYKVVLVPVLKIADPILAKKLEDFTEKGGTVVMSYRAGVRNKDNNLLLGEMVPGPLSSLLGIEVEEVESLYEGKSVAIEAEDGSAGTAEIWRDLVRVTAAKPLYTYSDRFYSEYAAITRNSFRSGAAYYIGCGADADTLNKLAKSIAKEAGLPAVQTNSGVEAVTRYIENEEFRIVINHNDHEETFEDIELAPFEYKVLPVQN